MTHTGSVAEVETEIRDAGAEIVWVLEYSRTFTPGTPEDCVDFVRSEGATEGWCVGDAQTRPDAMTFDESPFSVGRGFDIVVPRSTMTIEYTTSHGTPAGNENPSGEDVLAAVREIVDSVGSR